MLSSPFDRLNLHLLSPPQYACTAASWQVGVTLPRSKYHWLVESRPNTLEFPTKVALLWVTEPPPTQIWYCVQSSTAHLTGLNKEHSG